MIFIYVTNLSLVTLWLHLVTNLVTLEALRLDGIFRVIVTKKARKLRKNKFYTL